MSLEFMDGGPLDGRVIEMGDATNLVIPVQMWRGRGRTYTTDEYRREIKWVTPPAPKECPTCGHVEDTEDPVRVEPADLEPFFVNGHYRQSNNWIFEPPHIEAP